MARVAFQAARERRGRGDVGGQGQRAGGLAALAGDGDAGRAGVSRRAAGAPLRGFRGHAPGGRPGSHRRAAHREPLRRHPERRGGGAGGLAGPAARRPRSATGPGCSSRFTARRRTSPDGGSPIRSARSPARRCCCATASSCPRRRDGGANRRWRAVLNGGRCAPPTWPGRGSPRSAAARWVRRSRGGSQIGADGGAGEGLEVGHRAQARAGDLLGVLVQDAGGVAGLRRLPLAAPPRHLVIADLQREQALARRRW